jgi:hypothetical protein
MSTHPATPCWLLLLCRTTPLQEAAAAQQVVNDARFIAVHKFWQRLSQQERQQLLTVDLDTLRERANRLQEAVPPGVWM